jgi:hypothetical protein
MLTPRSSVPNTPTLNQPTPASPRLGAKPKPKPPLKSALRPPTPKAFSTTPITRLFTRTTVAVGETDTNTPSRFPERQNVLGAEGQGDAGIIEKNNPKVGFPSLHWDRGLVIAHNGMYLDRRTREIRSHYELREYALERTRAAFRQIFVPFVLRFRQLRINPKKSGHPTFPDL